ncbi:MAG: LapA family protein [Proteobacteria bacterium]|nr:LapA family protein [Pseudomonadota bacterium]MBU1716800.1 LapA family protein [Pseudomonadota bacterium]
MERIKLIAIVTLAILGTIVVLQNTEPVNTRILLWSITMPRAVLLLGTSLIGFAVGVLTTFFLSNRDKGYRNEPPPV